VFVRINCTSAIACAPVAKRSRVVSITHPKSQYSLQSLSSHQLRWREPSIVSYRHHRTKPVPKGGARPRKAKAAQRLLVAIHETEKPTENLWLAPLSHRLRRHREIPSIQHRNPQARSNTPPRDPRRGDGSPASPGGSPVGGARQVRMPLASATQVALSRLTRILLLVAALCLGAPTAGAGAATRRWMNTLAALWTTVLQTPNAQNPLFTDGCFDLGGTCAVRGQKKAAPAVPGQSPAPRYSSPRTHSSAARSRGRHPKGSRRE
jgi:hypothetical protein